MTDVECSVIVCTRHRPESLRRCLAALAALVHPSYEVIVVDNTPGDRDAEAAAAAAGARYVTEPQRGLSRARNTGARVAHGVVVAYIDDDAIADSRWLTHLADVLKDPGLAAATGRVLPIDTSTPAAVQWVRTGAEDLGEEPLRFSRETPDWFEMSNFGGIGLGPNMAFKRELFDTGWRFRESLGLGAPIPVGEEHYAFFTIIRQGGAIAYVPDAVVFHKIPGTMDDLLQRKRWMLSGAAAYLAMLVAEEPGFRGRSLRYALQAARGKRRAWRVGDKSIPFASRTESFRAAFAGLELYLQSRLTARPEPTVGSEMPPP